LAILACVVVLRRSLNDKGGVVSSLRISPGEHVLISVREHDAPAIEFNGLAPAAQPASVDGD